MHIFLDESGSFSWSSPGISPIVSLIVPDRSMDALKSRFLAWKGSIIGKSRRELKGRDLTPTQLQSFTCQVLPYNQREPLITVAGADTELTEEMFVAKARDQLSEQYAYTAKLLLAHEPPNRSLAQQYTEVSGWTKSRSTVNFLWIATVEQAIADAVQVMVCGFMEPEDDQEFANIEISIDRSFIKRPEHVVFWKEFIRLAHLDRSRRKIAFLLPNTWRHRNHPFHSKYDGGGCRDFSDLFHNHMHFVDSKTSIGIQIADVCAQICLRYHRGKIDLKAYEFLRKRIIGAGGTTLTLKHFDQRSLYTDGVQNHVRLRSVDELKRQVRSKTENRL